MSPDPNSNVTHNANGTEWYNADNWSFGFAPGGQSVSKSQCDTTSGSGRLCLHTINSAGGYRFNDIISFGADYEKVIYTNSGGAVPEPASWAMLIAGFGLVGAVARRRRVATAA
jgi:hypothetical protein|nr:PEPxxWA-CTERM sorting domain-containing protein [Sandarakinorhabdus sp.]